MKVANPELTLGWWPYGLHVHYSRNGLVLRPRRKARQGWARAFRGKRSVPDNLSALRQTQNRFDVTEWEW